MYSLANKETKIATKLAKKLAKIKNSNKAVALNRNSCYSIRKR